MSTCKHGTSSGAFTTDVDTGRLASPFRVYLHVLPPPPFVLVGSQRLSIFRDAGKQLEERKKEAAAPKVEEAVEAVEEVRPEVVNSPNDVSDSLELEKGTPRDLAIMLGQLAVVSSDVTMTRGCGVLDRGFVFNAIRVRDAV